MLAPVTVVIPTLHEAEQIAECVRHLDWAGEIIVADGGSTDRTQDLARAAGAQVLEGPFATIAEQRNTAIAQARHEWVFALDADERVSPALAAEIAAAVAAPAHEAYFVRRRNVYLGREIRHAGWGTDWKRRLFRRDRRFVVRRVHEGLEPVADTGRLRAPLEHTPYRDLAEHFRKVGLYAELAARDFADAGREPRLTDLTVRPALRFAKLALLQGGWRDGWRGILLSGFGAFGVFLKYARLWELRHGSDD